MSIKVSHDLGRLQARLEMIVVIFEVSRELGRLQARLEDFVLIIKVRRELNRLPGPSGKIIFIFGRIT